MVSKINLPRYGGLNNVYTPGISVEQAGERLRRLAYTEERLMRLFASRVVLMESRELKLLLARFQYEAAQQAEAIRSRVTELRLSKNKLKVSPDKALTALFNEADHLPDVVPFLAGVVEVLLPELVTAYKDYLATTNDLADYPSVRILRQNKAETEDHLGLLSQAYQALEPREQEKQIAAEWVEHLQAYLDAAGGFLGTGEKVELAPKYGAVKFALPHEINRDQAFERVWDFEKPARDEIEDYMHYMMSIRLSEVNVSEGLAFVLLETEDMPWSFYLDISRHLWDEMRHSIFGEVAIENSFGDRAALPMRDYEGVYAYQAEPLEQYATLGLEIEGKGMKYPPGKRWEWEFSRDDAKHPLMTTFQDFDWADEVLHVNIARRQLDEWFDGGLKAILPFSSAGKENRDAIKDSQPKVRVAPK